MKKILTLLLCALLAVPAAVPASAHAASARMPASDAISHGRINKVTYIYWGKSELFPIIAMVGPGTELDVYEYDKDWVLVLYDTYVKQGNSGQSHSFYGYVKRSDITCDPALEGEQSDKADTGPGKRKGKKPKGNQSAAPTAEESASAAPSATPEASPEPEPTVEQLEEYDWIIRTPGLCSVDIAQSDGTVMHVKFAMMAQKIGGVAASSDPLYNNGMHNPYGAVGFFSLTASMMEMLQNWGATQYLSGSGGVSIVGDAPAAKFYIDTKSDNFALVNFTLNMNAHAKLDPKITDGNVTGSFSTELDMPLPLPVQLKKSGGGYQFVLKGIRPGGGDITFPAVLEKAHTDPDRWQKEAEDADRRRKEAEAQMKKMLEKLKEILKKDWGAQSSAAPAATPGESSTTGPMSVPDDDGDDIILAPLVTPDPLAPLETEPPLAPLVTPEPSYPDLPPLAPLTPSSDEAVTDFPSQQN